MSVIIAHALAELHHRTLGSTVEGWTAESFSRLIKNKDAVLTSIDAAKSLNPHENGRSFVGFILSLKIGPEAELLTLVIAPDYQRQGLGSSLIVGQEQTLRRQGVMTWYLEVHEHNEPALAFYKKMGFSLDGHRPNYYPAWDSLHKGRAAALMMHRDLS
jgi:ribosomal-protein-alanine N-acetyltransferase